MHQTELVIRGRRVVTEHSVGPASVHITRGHISSISMFEDVPAGAYQYPDFIRRYEDRGQTITVNANGAITADGRLIPAN